MNKSKAGSSKAGVALRKDKDDKCKCGCGPGCDAWNKYYLENQVLIKLRKVSRDQILQNLRNRIAQNENNNNGLNQQKDNKRLKKKGTKEDGEKGNREKGETNEQAESQDSTETTPLATMDCNESEVEEDDKTSGDSASSDEEDDNITKINIGQELDEEMELIVSCHGVPSDDNYFKTSSTPTCLRFSPTSCILCVGNFIGNLEIYSYDGLNVKRSSKIEAFSEQSCLGTDFSHDGRLIYVISENGVALINTSKFDITNFCEFDVKNKFTCLRSLDRCSFCVGDAKGNVMIWDSRKIRPYQIPPYDMKGTDGTDEYLADILVTRNGYIVTAGGGGVMAVFDKRNMKKPYKTFATGTSDLTSLSSTRNDEVIIAGSIKGDIIYTNSILTKDSQYHIFSPVYKTACNDILATDDGKIFTSWDDHYLRLYSLFPHKYIETFGKQQCFPPENIDVNIEGNMVSSIGHEKKIYLWDIRHVYRAKPKEQNPNKRITRNSFFNRL